MMNRPALLTVITCYLIFASAPAYAYLDPGTGSMMLQALIGALAGGLVMARNYWTKIKGFFSGAKREPSDRGSAEESDSKRRQ